MSSTELLAIGVSIVALFGGIYAIYYQSKQNQRDIRREQIEKEDRAVRAGIEPVAREVDRLRDEILEITKDRDAWRARCWQMEDRANGRQPEGDR